MVDSPIKPCSEASMGTRTQQEMLLSSRLTRPMQVPTKIIKALSIRLVVPPASLLSPRPLMSTDVWVLSYEHLKGLPKPDQALNLLPKIISRASSRSFPSIIGDFLSSPSFFQSVQVSWVCVPTPLMSYGILRQIHVSMTDKTS